jgi:endoglucanase
MWFAQSPGNYPVQRLQTFTTAEDLALIAKLGFDHIRLSIDAVPLVEWERAGHATSFIAELDRVVNAALADKLSVILDIHPESAYKHELLQGTESVERFRALWQALAAHYASSDPEHVFFEIMNEPEQKDPYRWIGIEAAVVDSIRQAAPKHTIIATGAQWSGLEDLLMLEPLADPDVIYTFHDYEPFPFTHQSATWTDVRVEPLRMIPYPSSPETVAPKLGQEPTLASQYWFQAYGLGRWDAARIESNIEFVARWSKLHQVPIYCGEFGALRDHTDPAMRAAWIRDTRQALEKNGIGWAMWDYQTNFGVVTKSNGATTPDAQVLAALGLKGSGE